MNCCSNRLFNFKKNGYREYPVSTRLISTTKEFWAFFQKERLKRGGGGIGDNLFLPGQA